jgi:alkylhydroperoxidase family enzyme
MQQDITEALYTHLDDGYRQHADYQDAEKVAIEYAERYALDHLAIDDELFQRLLEHFDSGEILELTVIIARHLGFGRLTQVLGLDIDCPLDPNDSRVGDQSSETPTGSSALP